MTMASASDFRGHTYEDALFFPAPSFPSHEACRAWARSALSAHVSNPAYPACRQPITVCIGPKQILRIFTLREDIMRRFPDGLKYPLSVVKASVGYAATVLRASIYVCIREGRVRLFVPFTSGDSFQNDWHRLLRPRALVRGAGTIRPQNFWANAVVLCTKPSPDYWSASHVCAYLHLLQAALKVTGAPRDAEFLLNKRDSPCSRVDRSHPWTHLFAASFNRPTVRPARMLEVCSPYAHSGVYADKFVPLASDWALATGLFFPGDGGRSIPSFACVSPVPWDERTNILFFRGSSTGYGSGPQSNTRMRLAALSREHGDIMDCGITSFSKRVKVCHGCASRDDAVELRRLQKQFVALRSQRRYKYMAVVDGHSAPNRLATVMHFESVLFIVDSDAATCGKEMWFSRFLLPNVHYVPVRNDLSDLVEKLRHALCHDAESRAIATRCRELALRLFTPVSMLAHAAKTLAKCTPPSPSAATGH